MVAQDQTPNFKNTENDEIVDYGKEPKNRLPFSYTEKENYSSQKLRFAKLVVIFAFLMLMGVSVAVIAADPKNGVKDVFDFNKLFLTNVVTLVLGYFFGTKSKGN